MNSGKLKIAWLGDFCYFYFGEGLAVAFLLAGAGLALVLENDLFGSAALFQYLAGDCGSGDNRGADGGAVPVYL